MNIAEPKDIADIGLVRFRLQRVAKKNHEIQVIVLNLCAELLLTAQVSGEILVNREVVTSSTRRPVVPVANSVCFASIPR